MRKHLMAALIMTGMGVVGCDKTISSTERTTKSPDGSQSTTEQRTVQHPDGSVTTEKNVNVKQNNGPY